MYPAVAVAEALKRRFGDGVEILFVGAEGKMEMEKVPALGYPIVGLPVAGLQRRLTLRNLTVPVKVLASLVKARRVIRRFGADVAVGFGGYASAPVLWSAQRMGIPRMGAQRHCSLPYRLIQQLDRKSRVRPHPHRRRSVGNHAAERRAAPRRPVQAESALGRRLR